MSAVDEDIIREYFEGNGFFVRQLPASRVSSRKKAAEEERALLVFNPGFRSAERRPEFLLFSSELPYIHRAVVVLRGWHVSRVTAGMLKSSAKVFRFLEQGLRQPLVHPLPPSAGAGSQENALKILVLPTLPTAEPFRSQAIELLQARGVDGMISFRSMLLEVAGRVDINLTYPGSGALETIRVLKNYDLLRETQMELFGEGKT